MRRPEVHRGGVPFSGQSRSGPFPGGRKAGRTMPEPGTGMLCLRTLRLCRPLRRGAGLHRTLRRLEAARDSFGSRRLALWIERTAEDFLLPSPSGTGAPLTVEELERRREEYGADIFFSGELCAHYFTYMAGEKGHFVLFDDAGSIQKKLRLASALGIKTAFLPYETTGDLLKDLLEKGT